MSEKLKVHTAGTRRYIDVPSSRAASLHSYLRAHGIASSPPEPSSTDIDSIELAKGVDIKTIQALLDRWA